MKYLFRFLAFVYAVWIVVKATFLIGTTTTASVITPLGAWLFIAIVLVGLVLSYLAGFEDRHYG